jgi:3-deoxy-D-arabino-heptulosonate 7-phosphate (DAHP) synthase class II
MSRGWNDDDRTTEMIDSYRGDVFFHLILDERRREAERRRLLLAYREPGVTARFMAGIGRLLMRTGKRLQEAAMPATPAWLVDPCHGCAN